MESSIKTHSFPLLLLICILVIYAEAQANTECPQLYLRYCSTHSYCKPANPKCNVVRSHITEDEKNTILKEHNNYRSSLAMGKDKKLPEAADMLEMVWDDELADIAQKHALQCNNDHDHGDCRRVHNFGVGQNIALEEIYDSHSKPNPDWPRMIKRWYDEIAYFNCNAIDPFIASDSDPTYGHFAQIVWAKTFKVGCGFVIHQHGNTHENFYVCNYGPSGNIIPESMYKVGSPCSSCPINSRCKECGYPGLCKIMDNKAPIYRPVGSYLFYCDFNNQSDCQRYTTGIDKWEVHNALSGNFLSIVLKGGEESSLTFQKKIKHDSKAFCVISKYRKGSNEHGKEEASTVTKIFSGTGFQIKKEMPTPEDSKHEFNSAKMDLGWNNETKITVKFEVPEGKPEQFFEIKSIYAYEGHCK